MWNGNIESHAHESSRTRIPCRYPRQGTIQAESILHSIPFLQLLPMRTREKVIRQFRSVSFPFGSIIVEGNHHTEAIYVIGSGRVCARSHNRLGQETTVSMLEPGNFFGEIGLLPIPYRTATIQTCDHVQALTLDKRVLKDLFVTHPQLEAFFRHHAQQVDIHHFLRLESLFSHMPPPILSRLRANLAPVNFRANQWIIREGEKPRSIYLVRKGRLQAFRGEGDEWEEAKDISAGDVFGELAPFRKTVRTSNVRAVTDGTCLTLDLQTFLELLDHAPSFKWQIEMIMGCHRWAST